MCAVLLLCLRHMPFGKDVDEHYFWVLVLMASSRSNKRRTKKMFLSPLCGSVFGLVLEANIVALF